MRISDWSSDVCSSDLDRNSKSDVTSYTAALYGGNSWKTAKGQVNFLAGAAYTTNEVDSRRTVTVGGSQTLKADYDVNTTQLFTELGYAIPVGQPTVETGSTHVWTPVPHATIVCRLLLATNRS